MAGPQDIQQALFTTSLTRVAQLRDEGRWPEALQEAVTLFERFPYAPRACIGLAETLLLMDRYDTAEQVLRRACQKFPGESWLAFWLADLVGTRGHWAEAVALWRQGGLSEDGTPEQLRGFARALAGSGDLKSAISVVQTGPTAHDPLLQLTAAELLVRAGRFDEAAALWPAFSPHFGFEHAEFTAITGQLALQADQAQAAPMLALLLAEQDPGTRTWRPALVSVMAKVVPGDAASARVRQALLSAPLGTTRSVAARLAGAPTSIDQMTLQIAAYVTAGQSAVLPFLFETAGQAKRTADLTVALRLYLNRTLADPAKFAQLSAQSLCVLLQIARVADSTCFEYIAELARPHFAAVPAPDWTQPAHLAACAVWPTAAAIDRHPPPVRPRLQIAVCLFGRMPFALTGWNPLRALGLHEQEVQVFANMWQASTSSPSVVELTTILRRLPPNLRHAFAATAEAGGMAGLRRLYPSLLQACQQQANDDQDDHRIPLNADQCVVQDENDKIFAGRDAVWKSRYTAHAAFGMAQAARQSFDLVVFLDAEEDIGLNVDWPDLMAHARRGGIVFADRSYQFDRLHGFTLTPRIAIGAPGVMQLMAQSFTLGSAIIAGQRRIDGIRAQEAMAQSLALQLHFSGVGVQTLEDVVVGSEAIIGDPIEPSVALSLLWKDIRARPPATPDSLLVHAATSEVSGYSLT